MNITNRLSLILNIRWVQHLAFWIFFISIMLLRFMEMEPNQLIQHLTYEAISLPLIISTIYVNLLLLIPLLWNKKRYILYSLLLTLTIMISLSLTASFIYIGHLNMSHIFVKPFYLGRIVGINFARTFMFLSLTSLIHFVKEWIKLKDDNIQLKERTQEQLEAELKTLKGQVNPHFLFNTLNNLYSMSLYDSSKTPEMILKLSQLISYMLYECKDELVPLEKEILFIENYIQLESIRVEDVAHINFEVTGNDPGHKIPPLLFIPLVENAFKHGVDPQQEISQINISVHIQPHNILLSIENPMDNENKKYDKNPHKGLGIQNVRKRLKLLYPNNHTFLSQQKGGLFVTKLNLTV